jgi:lipopolysaccharide/colanic/teichoic acid biosynthesis glycosyltransferase
MYRRNGNSRTGAALRAGHYGLLSTELFSQTLCLERKRTERSGRSFVLMLLEAPALLNAKSDRQAIEEVLSVLSRSTRDTDIKGWHKRGSMVGVIFTELGANVDGNSALKALEARMTKALGSTLSTGQISQIRLSFRAYPENWEEGNPAGGKDTNFYDDLLQDTALDPVLRVVKRSMDIAGSLLALICSLPLFVAIAAAIKLTSKGPVFFRQQRLGQYGKKFGFLKFRSMYVNNDESIHREFVKSFISKGEGSSDGQYKLTADPRVTRVGRFLRKTSLDELPQFLNVLMGKMSLVGPRPPIPYEVESYDIWHRTRLLAAKPGITGLWQVSGRSRVKFDDMVRMDLQYAKCWSLWLDIKILLQTPHAVLSGTGAH